MRSPNAEYYVGLSSHAHKRRETLRRMPLIRLLIFESGWGWRGLPGGYRFVLPGPDGTYLDLWPSSGKWAVHSPKRKSVYRQGFTQMQKYVGKLVRGEL